MPTTIGTLADAVLLCQNIRAERAPFSYDIETNGLRAETSDIIGMAISWKRGTFYFPLLHHEPMRDAYAGGLTKWAAEVAEYDAERAQGIKKKDRKWATKPKKPVKATFEEQTRDLPMDARNLPFQSFWGCVAELFSDPTVPKFAHNSPFDFRRIKKTAKDWTGREIPFVAANFHDTLIMTYALSEHLARVWGGLDLNTVAANTVGVRKSEKALEEWFSARGVKKKGTQKGSLAFAPLELVADYCGMDAILVRKVARVQLPKVQADEGCLKLYKREIALVETTIAMEDAPKHIALERAKATYETGKERLVSLKAAVVDLGLPSTDNAAWNPDSNDELAKVLRKMGCHLPFAPATKEKFERGEEVETIKYSVDAKALEPHRRLPIISALLRYRRLEKRIGTDFASVLEYTLPSATDPAMGTLHAGISQTTARTGRLASSKPNMQNWTRDDDSDEWASEFSIRAAWVVAPPACGCKICDGSGGTDDRTACWACGGTGDARRVIISADLKQIEPRITAHLTKDENLIRVYREGRDVYVEIGKIAFGLEPALPDKEWKKKYPDERQAAKAIVLAILYGAGISKIRFMVTDSVMEVIDGRLAFLKRKWEAGEITEEAREALLAEVKALKKRRATFSFGDEDSRRVLDKMAERFPGIFDYKAYLTEGYERRKYVRNPWGRKLYLPHEDATYMLLNAIVQSSAADLLKQATLDVYRALKESGLDCNLLWSIHDELLFDCLAADAEKASAIIVREMTKFPLRVPLESDLSITATSLKDAIEWDLKDGVPWEKLWGISN